MDIVTAIVTPVVEYLMVPVKKHLGYLISCTKYVRDMGTKMRLLKAKRVDVEEHMNRNKSNNLKVPTEVDGWLEKVVKIDEKVGSISSDVGGCFNLKRRHEFGRKAFKITEEINSLIEENDMINWTDHRIPLGKVNSNKASTSTPPSHHNDFPSREQTYMEALKQLHPDHKSRMIALCGMGGVGKTTMMEKLKKVAEEGKLFDMIVKVVIGEGTNTISIQDAVADYLGICLTEKSESARSDRLRKSFESHSDGGKKKILVILDDVWEFLDLNDIGLSPLPNQGVGFKILLTSRIQDVCSSMEVDSIFDVKTIEDHEAQSFFHQCVKAPNGGDLDFNLHEIGNDIANRCHGLPIAIKTIAKFLKSYRSDKWVWENTLSSLKNKKVEEAVYKIFEISYNHLQDEEIRLTLLLCGVFPEDFDTPREDLVRYGWGLRLFNSVHTIREARNRLNTCIEQLINANLLIRSQLVNHVKMHDLVRAFVLKVCSNSEHASYIGDISKWSEENTSEICKRISLTCTGMSEFPRNFKFPNLSLLKLMHGDKSLKFPEDFYEDMNKLQVIAYDQIEYPLLSRSLACSNLRTLCLYRCSLMFDFSSIGNLSNLEVLSLADCSVRRLPSTIGNLKELKLLDLTGCIDLIIDDGVLKNLIKIEELYVKVGSINMYTHEKKAIRFTDSICNELAELSKNLFALEIEFFDNNALPKNMSFKKLERFKISLGCYLDDGQNTHSYENTLMLVTDKCELLDFRINELFEKTEVLRLQVNGVNNLGHGLVESLCHQRSPFYSLRVLEIRQCENLKYLFTVCVADGLTKLERLTVLSCPVLETLVDGENGELGVIKFQVLKFLSLRKLPKLMSLCTAVNLIELPQLEELILDNLPNFTSIYPDYSKSATSSMSNDISTMQPFLNKEVVIPKLEKLYISNMENLKEIWACEFSTSEEVDDCILRDVRVEGCDSVLNLFPSNPMSLLHHLEELEVIHCGSIEVLFDIDLRCAGKNDEVGSCLRSIQVSNAENLREVWRIKGANDVGDHVINGFQAIESIVIEKCKRFRNVFTPTTTNFDLRGLTKLTISSERGESERADEMVNSRQEQEINVAFPSYLIHVFHNLHNLSINNYRGAEVEVVFEIETPCSRELATTPQSNQQPPRLCYLKDLELEHMERMSHVWKCNWNKFLISQKQQPQSSSSSFHNLTTINLKRCKNIKYLFSPLMAKLLSNLKEIHIWNCDVIEEVVSNRDDDDEELVASTSTNTSFPYLDTLYLSQLPNLKCIGGASGAKGGSKEISSIHDQSKIPQVNDVAWSLCQYARDIWIDNCEALPHVIPSYARAQMQKLENLRIWSCKSLVEVFESQGFNIDKEIGGNDATMEIPRMKVINVPHLSNLKDLVVENCDLLQHVFTFSTLESLRHLEKLRIGDCKAMKVIVKEDNGEKATISSMVVLFPRLKLIKLCKLPNLVGFFFGTNEFRWPLLDFVMIDACPQMMVFTSGRSIAPKVNYIHTELGKHSLECGLNFPVMAATLHESLFSSLDSTNSCATTSEAGTPWSFHNLIEMDVNYNYDVKKIIPSNELLQLQKLEKIYVYGCIQVEEVFEALEGTDSSDQLQSVVVVEIPKLREVELLGVHKLKYIWKNNPWMVLEFPNLTKLSIDICHSLEHVFSSSMVGSLLQLQDLHIECCNNLEVIVKEANVVVEEEGDEEEECDDKVNNEIIIMLPRLKSLILDNLPSLKGFYLGKEAFSLPSLDTLGIIECRAIRVFTKGDLATPELKVIKDTSFGRCELGREEDVNSFINTKLTGSSILVRR